MAMIKGLVGFIVGLAFGGAALVALTIFVPQLCAVSTPAPQVTVKTTVPAPKPVVAPKIPKVKTTPEPTETVVPKVETAKIAKPEASKPAVVAPKVTEPIIVQPKPAEPGIGKPASKIVLNSENPDKPKLFDLPTIAPDQPADNADEPPKILDLPKPDNAITIGKKPSSALPSISAKPAEPATPGAALELFATKFDAPDRPLLGVILLDMGDKGLSIDQLKSLNAPLTIAIRSDAPNASGRALAYEAAGFEVIAMASDATTAPLAQALTTKSVHDAIDVMFTTVPNAIGLLDSADQKIQKNSRISKAIIDVFVGTGHGLVTYAKGLNSVDREARALGVRTAKVVRKLDANRENKAMMLRYLDRAALDAGRDGAAIVLGTTAKDTVAALAGWVFSSKGKSVALAPASAVLLGK